MDDLEAAFWASRNLSAAEAMAASSINEEKSVMHARTFSGNLFNQRARSMSMDFGVPVASGGRRARERSSDKASEGR